jgi:rRNA maturation RNase YbeY
LNNGIFYDNVNFRFKGWRKFKRVVNKVIASEKRISGDLNFIITNNKNLRKINIEFLKHNYLTDVIAFNYCHENIISGEIYLSIDTVRRNAYNYKVSLNQEVMRVMIHGVLHLCGYDDKTKEEQNRMRRKEDKWIMVFEDRSI